MLHSKASDKGQVVRLKDAKLQIVLFLLISYRKNVYVKIYAELLYIQRILVTGI